MSYHINNFIPLTPILHPWIDTLLQQNSKLQKMIATEGSPVNLHSLTPFVENLKSYQEVFQRYALPHKIFFARKANKGLPFAKVASQEGHGVDTASYRELKQCLDAGIRGSDLVLTAAIKNRSLLELAAAHGVTIVIDNLDELQLLQEILVGKPYQALINIRLGGFKQGQTNMHTRFGFSIDEAFELINEIKKNERSIHFKGVHFHLNGYSITQRVAAIEESITLIDRLKAVGIHSYSLDIGGGFLMNYLAKQAEWDLFHQELKKAILNLRDPITYDNDPLGIVEIEGKLHGEPKVYPYYNELHKEKFLETILNSFSERYQRPIYEVIRDRQLTVHIEPGRSLLDQAGITIAKVAFRKKDSRGNLLVGLEMNHSQLKSSSADFLLDPIHIMQADQDKHVGIHEGFLVGAYCLEQELILKRKVQFKQFPAIGDLFIFPNTAGYMMHFFESEAHLFELAKNIFHDS